jgi:hypothetical protein
MGLLDGLEQKPKPKIKKEREFEVEIDLDEGKVIPTKQTRKSRLREDSPDRVFDTRLTQEEYDFLIAIMNKHTNGKLKFDWRGLKKKLWEMSKK